MKKVIVVLLLLFSFSFALAENSENVTEITITSESGEVFTFNDSNLVEAYPQKSIFQKMFSFTGFASKGPSCGSLGSSKKYAQNQLSCQGKANSCPSGSKNLGATYDCKSCCASDSSSGSGSGSGKVGVPPASGVKTANLKNNAECCSTLTIVLTSSGCGRTKALCEKRINSINSFCPGLSASLDKDRKGVSNTYNVQLSSRYVSGSFSPPFDGKNYFPSACSYSYK